MICSAHSSPILSPCRSPALPPAAAEPPPEASTTAPSPPRSALAIALKSCTGAKMKKWPGAPSLRRRVIMCLTSGRRLSHAEKVKGGSDALAFEAADEAVTAVEVGGAEERKDAKATRKKYRSRAARAD